MCLDAAEVSKARASGSAWEDARGWCHSGPHGSSTLQGACGAEVICSADSMSPRSGSESTQEEERVL